MSDQRIQEPERVEAVARRTLADILNHARRPGFTAHVCTGFDARMLCTTCGRDGHREPDVVTLFAGALGQCWVNATGGGRPVDYVPVATVLPVLRAYLAQGAELRRLRESIRDQALERADRE